MNKKTEPKIYWVIRYYIWTWHTVYFQTLHVSGPSSCDPSLTLNKARGRPQKWGWWACLKFTEEGDLHWMNLIIWPWREDFSSCGETEGHESSAKALSVTSSSSSVWDLTFSWLLNKILGWAAKLTEIYHCSYFFHNFVTPGTFLTPWILDALLFEY